MAPGGAPLPVKTPDYTERLNALGSRREAFAVAPVTKTGGSTPAKPGFKILISSRGEVVRGTLGGGCPEGPICEVALRAMLEDRKSTRLNSSHGYISYAVFCLKKKKKRTSIQER